MKSAKRVGPAGMYENPDQDSGEYCKLHVGYRPMCAQPLSPSNIRRLDYLNEMFPVVEKSVSGNCTSLTDAAVSIRTAPPTGISMLGGHYLNNAYIERHHAVSNGSCEMRSRCFANHATSTLL